MYTCKWFYKQHMAVTTGMGSIAMTVEQWQEHVLYLIYSEMKTQFMKDLIICFCEILTDLYRGCVQGRTDSVMRALLTCALPCLQIKTKDQETYCITATWKIRLLFFENRGVAKNVFTELSRKVAAKYNLRHHRPDSNRSTAGSVEAQRPSELKVLHLHRNTHWSTT